MNLLSGLEKFGLKGDGELDILNDGSEAKKKQTEKAKAEVVELTEKDFLLDSRICCRKEYNMQFREYRYSKT